jgi:hypothetical protein
MESKGVPAYMRSGQCPLPCACFDYSGFDRAPVRSWWCPPSKFKAGGQKSIAYQVAYPIPFWGVKWHHQTAQSAGGQVTIAAWNNEK